MSVRKSASSNGSGGTRQPPKRRRATTARRKSPCAHHWILDNTQYPIFEPNVGQVNLGRTRGRCKLCGKTRRWESATPDSVYGIESIVAFNVRQENGTLPEGFRLDDEDYDA